MDPELLQLLPLWYVVFLLSITCHEGAHAWGALLGGDPTAYLGGQVTLNPVPHVRREVMGTVIVPLLTYLNAGWMMGWASAPYDARWEERYPRRAALMAVAGPAANLVLAAIGFGVLKAGIVAGVWGPPDGPYLELDRLVAPAAGSAGLDGLGRFCSILFTLNLVLLVFNLIPLPPMDGSSVLAGLVAPLRGFYGRLRSASWAGFAGLVVAWLVFPHVFQPVYRSIVQWMWYD